MSISVNPIGPWPFVATAAAAVMALTIWAYRQKLRTSTGSWRYLALGLRLAAVLLCLLAALRPSINLPEKKKQAAVVVFLLDASKSLIMQDEIDGQSRWVVARKAIEAGKKAIEGRSKDLEVKQYLFSADLREQKVDDATVPDGRESHLGTGLIESVKQQGGINVAAIVLVSDGANNGGIPPLSAASQLRSKLIPVYAVGVGDENAGAGSKDIAVKDFVIGPVVFVKNQPEIKATISARGFSGRPIEVELLVEGEPGVVARTTVKPAAGAEVFNVPGLKYIPQTPGEKRVTLRVKPQDGELVTSNNEFTTYLTVLKGGLKVLYVQGPNFTWEILFLVRSLDAAKEIHVDTKVVREPAAGDRGKFDDADFAPNNYDVFILGDIAAEFLTARQQRMLAGAVTQGAGLIMLGGRSSFGEGGWQNSPLRDVSPVEIRGGEGQFEPKDGIKIEPNLTGLKDFVLRLGPTPEESRRAWEALPPLTGTNRFGRPKPLAFTLLKTRGTGDPLMVGLEPGRGRSIAFGGETWPWFRAEDGQNAHRRFWRQAILWLAHKEDSGDNEVKVRLDRRRLPRGQRLDITATARDPKKEPIPDVQFETTATRVDSTEVKSESVPIFPQGDEARGAYDALGLPGEYKIEVVAKKGGKEIGRDSARFNVFQDDREMENPAADRKLLRDIAEISGGRSVAPEELGKELATLDTGATERLSITSKQIWDNWYFFLIFTLLLSLEWWLRKRKGWV